MAPGTGGRRSSSGRSESKLVGGRLIDVGALGNQQEVHQEVVSGHRGGWLSGGGELGKKRKLLLYLVDTERGVERWEGLWNRSDRLRGCARSVQTGI